MKALTFSYLLLACLLSAAVAEKSPLGWAKLEVSLKPDSPRVPLGEPMFLSCVVKNNTDREVTVTIGEDYRSDLDKPVGFKVVVVDEKGDVVPQADPEDAIDGRVPEQKLRPSGSYNFRLFLPHWAVFRRPGVYQVRIIRVPTRNEVAVDQGAPFASVHACASSEIEILSPDRKRLGRLIDTLGERILRLHTSYSGSIDAREREARNSYMMLEAIRDERVIPYYLKLLRSDGYTLKYMAVRALARFNDDKALEGLKEAMLSKESDIRDTRNPEDGERLAEQIRHAAAVGLRKGPHPDGFAFLLLQQNDRSSAVRLEIVRGAASKLKPAEAIPVLEKMTHDSDEVVRQQAALCLDELRSSRCSLQDVNLPGPPLLSSGAREGKAKHSASGMIGLAAFCGAFRADQA